MDNRSNRWDERFYVGQTSWTVLISLNEGDKHLFGIIYQPFTDEMFIGFNNSCNYLHKSKTNKILAKIVKKFLMRLFILLIQIWGPILKICYVKIKSY